MKTFLPLRGVRRLCLVASLAAMIAAPTAARADDQAIVLNTTVDGAVLSIQVRDAIKSAVFVNIGGVIVPGTYAAATKTITATLPGALPAGTHRLILQKSTKNDEAALGTADITVGAIGATGPQGVPGVKGDTGATGAVGPSGAMGLPGPQGVAGPAGAQGPKGETGAIGTTGSQGPKGDVGAVGAAGPAGATGAQGAVGEAGPQGVAGARGDKGDTGAVGLTGAAGATGATGPAGAIGQTGPAGPQGSTGPQGVAGETGPAGAQGLPGVAGPKGDTGLNGATGAAGAQGPQGIAGESGAAGAKGDKGDRGDQGVAGAAGSSVTVVVEEPGQNLPQGGAKLTDAFNHIAYVANGAAGAAGPAGATGATGAVGPQGGPGSVGATGPQGPAGPQGAAGAIGPQGAVGIQGLTGTPGVAGAKGDRGDAGVAGAVGATGATGPVGPIGPQGPKGDPGATGAVGPAGATGTVGATGASPFMLLDGDAILPSGRVGIGMSSAPTSRLHVVGSPARASDAPTPGNHVVYIENTNDGPGAHGLAIRLTNTKNGEYGLTDASNFVTFYRNTTFKSAMLNPPESQIAGRIEAMSALDIAAMVDDIRTLVTQNIGLPSDIFNAFTLDLAMTPRSNWFDAGSFPTLSLKNGALPSAAFTKGLSPSASLNGGQLPSAIWDNGTLPTATFDPGSLPSLSINWAAFSFSFNAGSLPDLNFSRGVAPSLTFKPGSLPTLDFNNGSLPSLTFDPGSLPTLSVNGGSLPSASLPYSFGTPSFTLNATKINKIADILRSNFDHALLAYDLWTDPVAAAIQQTVTVLDGGGVTYESGAGDYAEWMERRDPAEKMKFGDIVGVHGGRISKDTKGAERLLVVSFKPIVLGNMPAPGREAASEKVAFMGQVPVKVFGRVKRGDYIIAMAGGEGVGRAVSPKDMTAAQLDRVVGVAWGDSALNGLKLVNVAVGLRAGDVVAVVQAQEQRVLELEAKLASVETTVARVQQLEARLSDVLATVEAKPLARATRQANAMAQVAREE